MKKIFSLILALLLVCAGFCAPCCASQNVDAYVGDVVDIWVSINNGGTVVLTPENGSPAPSQNRIALLGGQSDAFHVEIRDVGVFRYVLSVEPDTRRLVFDDTVYDVEIHALYEEDEIRTAVVIYNRRTGEKYTPVERYDPVSGQYTHTLSVSFYNYSAGSSSGRPNRPTSPSNPLNPTPDGTVLPTDDPNALHGGTEIPTDNPDSLPGGTELPTGDSDSLPGGAELPTDSPDVPHNGTEPSAENPDSLSGGGNPPSGSPSSSTGGSPSHTSGSPTDGPRSPQDESALSTQSSGRPPRAGDSARQPKTGDDTRLTHYLLLAVLASGGLFLVSAAYYVSVVLETRAGHRTSE